MASALQVHRLEEQLQQHKATAEEREEAAAEAARKATEAELYNKIVGEVEDEVNVRALSAVHGVVRWCASQTCGMRLVEHKAGQFCSHAASTSSVVKMQLRMS